MGEIDETRDLSAVVTEIMTQRFDWWTQQDTLSLLLDFAVNGVSTRLEEAPDDPGEHGIYIAFNHGDDCDGCQALNTFVFDLMTRNRPNAAEA